MKVRDVFPIWPRDELAAKALVFLLAYMTIDREIDILQALQERIIENSQLLVTCSDLCAELDV